MSLHILALGVQHFIKILQLVCVFLFFFFCTLSTTLTHATSPRASQPTHIHKRLATVGRKFCGWRRWCGCAGGVQPNLWAACCVESDLGGGSEHRGGGRGRLCWDRRAWSRTRLATRNNFCYSGKVHFSDERQVSFAQCKIWNGANLSFSTRGQ